MLAADEQLARGPQEVVLEVPGCLRLCLLDYAATMRSLSLVTHDGPRELLLGYPNAEGYLVDTQFVGATVGRYANRIAEGRYRQDGGTVELPRNDGRHALHGGPRGLHKQFWRIVSTSPSTAVLETELGCSDDGFPGTMRASARFEVEARSVQVTYRAEVDATCPVNITAHPYFRLCDGTTLLGHQFRILATRYIPVDAEGIPLGPLRSTEGSAFDFGRLRAIAPRDLAVDAQLRQFRGYDHCYALSRAGAGARPAAIAYSPDSGVGVVLSSNMPGVQFYTGNGLAKPFARWAGFCLEPGYWPDSPNRIEYPCTMLEPGAHYQHTIRYDFFVHPRGQGSTPGPW
jgi:aldose 1-epimerase